MHVKSEIPPRAPARAEARGLVSLRHPALLAACPEWAGYILDNFRFEFARKSRILDLGCGEGAQLLRLADQGAWACGIDLSTVAVQSCRKRNLVVVQAKAERLPFLPQSFDGVICKVLLPYTDERATISEIGRVLRPAGTAYVVSHGAGYYLRYLLLPPRFAYRVSGRAPF